MAGAAAAQELGTVAYGEQFSSGPIVRGKASPRRHTGHRTSSKAKRSLPQSSQTNDRA